MLSLGIIPARFASTRFPGKPLALLGNKTIIQHVYEKAVNSVDYLVVATDNIDIYNHVSSFGGNVVMTSENHKTGTDRCLEAYVSLKKHYDIIINIQGDEPFIDPKQIELLKSCFVNDKTDIATLIKPFDATATFNDIQNPNSPKVVTDINGKALFFSRSVIPYFRGEAEALWTTKHQYYKHIGIYAYRSEILKKIALLKQTPLEIAESLEQLRWLENGLYIQTAITHIETIGIDTPEDLEIAQQLL